MALISIHNQHIQEKKKKKIFKCY